MKFNFDHLATSDIEGRVVRILDRHLHVEIVVDRRVVNVEPGEAGTGCVQQTD